MKYTLEEYRADCRFLANTCDDWKELYSIENALRRRLNYGIEEGDGVTLHMYSDSHACTVIRRTPKMIVVQRDIARRTDNNGMSDMQEYEYSPDPTGNIEKCYWSNVRGCFVWNTKAVTPGRREYYDYSF